MAAVVAVTDAADAGERLRSRTLQALTAAALLLPGLQSALAQSADSTDLQVARFSEGTRNTGVATVPNPLTAYTLGVTTSRLLANGDTLRLGLQQDSWSGATPVSVAPLAFGGNRPILHNGNSGVVISGASPLLNGVVPLQALAVAVDGNELIMASASPELRQQLDAGYEFAAPGRRHDINLSVSNEPDFRSWHVSSGHRLDFNRQQSSLSLSAAYTHSDIDAVLDARYSPYVNFDREDPSFHREGSLLVREGVRSERSVTLGISHALDRSALLDFNYTVSNSSGLLSHPYRAVLAVFTPAALLAASPSTAAEVHAVSEQRPQSRLQHSASLRHVQAIERFNGAFHTTLSWSQDDWGIRSQSLEVAWVQRVGAWEFSPRLRWYSQEAADFHVDYLHTAQAYRSLARDAAGREIWRDSEQRTQQYLRTATGDFLDQQGRVIDATMLSLVPDFVTFSRALLPAAYSSDHRLGAFGTLSAGLSLHYRLTPILTLQAGIDYYRRASSLQWSGTGNTPYADQHYVSAAVSLHYDWEPARSSGPSLGSAHRALHADMAFMSPAGVNFAHAPMQAHALSTGYRLHRPDPDTVMHMVELAYGIDEHWQFMLMPEFMSVSGTDTDGAATHALHATAGEPHSSGPTQVSNVLTWISATEQVASRWQISTALSLPLSNRETSALVPSILHTWRDKAWNVGQQVQGRVELGTHPRQSHNPELQWSASAWLGRQLHPTLQLSVRGEYLHGQQDDAQWQRTAAGIGITAGIFGQSIQLEWMHPLATSSKTPADQRFPSLSARWHLAL